ncbi:MAG: helix-turn-helix domain-containing protein [Chloroflexi bacterium]|nr:helix-turn-helix domain-containing protein [Chloroflexota bacterium]
MARARAMARSTIAGHLADLLLAGAIEHLDGLVPVEKVALIREVTGDRPFKELGPVKERLGDQVTYEDLHLVRAYVAARFNNPTTS